MKNNYMSSGVNKLILAGMAKGGNPKGSALKSALGSAFSPRAIAGKRVEKQSMKKVGC